MIKIYRLLMVMFLVSCGDAVDKTDKAIVLNNGDNISNDAQNSDRQMPSNRVLG